LTARSFNEPCEPVLSNNTFGPRRAHLFCADRRMSRKTPSMFKMLVLCTTNRSFACVNRVCKALSFFAALARFSGRVRLLWAHALNRFAIRSLVACVGLNRDLLRGFWCRVCAVGRGDLASIDRGFSHEHSDTDDHDTASRPHDRGYVGAQSWPGLPDQSPARLQAVCSLAGAVTGDGDAR